MKPNKPKSYALRLKSEYTIGIDEVGRGSLAGPVAVAALALPQAASIKYHVSGIPLRDSKKLNPKQREIWFKYIKTQINADKNADKRRKNISARLSPARLASRLEAGGSPSAPARLRLRANSLAGGHADGGQVNQRSNQRKSAICYAVANVSPKIIDRINIANAANLAATRALQRLIARRKLRLVDCKILLDGNLYINKPTTDNLQLTTENLKLKTIIKGDEKIPAIMLASIIAKVTRDRTMRRLAKKYPKYGFSQHKGYGTKKHVRAIKKYGLSPVHRRSFRIKH